MTDCLFCKIIRKEIGAEVILENEAVLAFLDIYPRTLGHTVVVPKYHAATIIELPDAEVEPLFLTVKKITGILESTLKPDGFTIGINHGDVSGQTIGHIHVHVIPRWRGDKGGSIHSVVDNPPMESIQNVAKRIRGH